LNLIRDYIILGALQGFTEFLPVSSSGHLALAQHILGIKEGQLALSVFMHLGTVCALFVFFFRDILATLKDPKTLLRLLLTTAITGCIGLAGKDIFEQLFSSPSAIAFSLLITASLLIAASRFMQGQRSDFSSTDALTLGLTQGLAVVPGISRSGTTIATLLFRGLTRKRAFVVSFLAGLPAMAGAGLIEARQITGIARAHPPAVICGFLSSFLCGIIALFFLRSALQKARLQYLGYYCIIVAIYTFVFIR